MPTKISWTDETWPVVTGCTHAGGPGCDHCYGARLAATRLRDHPRYKGLATIHNGKARWTGKVNLNYDVLEQPLRWRRPRMIFVASMGDLFHEDVSDDFIIDVFVRMGEAPQHIFQVLTKRPDRMCDFILKSTWGTSPLHNLWLGTSIENQAAADERIPWLLQAPAAVHYVSVEPMLGAVVLPSYDEYIHPDGFGYNGPMSTTLGYAHEPDSPIGWVICGGESGPGARPMHPDWARSLRDQCQVAGVPYFFKQHGEWLHVSQCTGQSLSGPHHWWGRKELKAKDISYRIGKKRAGHLLDGRTWQEFPVSAKTIA